MNNANPTTVSVGAGVGHRSASGDASFGSGSSLSSLQNEHSNALSNDALHNGIDACSEDARIDQALSDDALSTLDNDTIMNDSGELLEFDFDSEIQPLGMDHQASMARDIKMLRRRLFEATRLSITMPEDGTLASNAGALKRQLIMAKENYDLLFDDTPMLSPSMAYSNAANSIVPPDTPYIQWKGHKFNNKKFVYPTMDACLQQFQDVLESRGVSIEANWKRIIKPKMSTGMSAWTREIIQKYPEITWGQFKSKLKVKYSPSEAEERKAALNKLKTLKLDNCDNLEDFIDRFNSLKDLAGVKENTSLVDYLLRGLDIDLYGPVSMGISQARSRGSDTLDFAISQLRSAYDLLRRDDYYRQEKQRKDAELNNKIKDAIKAHQRAEGSASLSNKKTRRAGRRHDKQSRKRNDSPGEVLKCYDCGFTPFTYAHKALCKKNPKNIKKITKKKSKLIVPRPASNDDTDSSSSDEESDQTFAVATISTKDKQKEEVVSMDTDSECKHLNNEYFKKMPSNNMDTNGLLYLPVILESKSGVKVNTWFLLDTGCTFSAISPKLLDFMQLNVVNKNGIIKLAQSNTVVNRKGQTEEELKINYGSKVVYSKFEVFDLFDDVHCVFGMDLLYKVGITLGNIAADWSDRIGYEIPDIEPNPYKPNEDPYGSKEERQLMMNELQPFIDANTSISPKAYCNLPDSEIRLPIKKDTPLSDTCRRQFPIAEAMRPVIQKQVEKWRENGVIKRAKPNTPHNSPIFTVRKKNSEGEYTGKEHRVVIDCRLINNALDPEKLERFPLPLISDLHRKMSKHSLYTVIDLSQCFHAFKVAKASRPYLTFTDMNGLTWSFSHCPYGLTMVSSHAQKILSNLLADLSNVCTHFIDDVTIHTENDLQKHTEVVKTVIDRLTRANLRINTEKMHIAQKSIYILGFCLSSNGLALDPRKVSNVLDWDPVVKSSRELMSRLGLINFFRSNLPCLSRLTAPLDKLRNAHDITKVWKPEHTALMKQLQELLVSSAVLSVPNLNYPICVVTDSSAYAIGAAMYQVINNKVKYLGFIARSLGPSEQRWGSSKRELAAVVYAFKKFHQWLYGRPFHLFVDNRGILFLHTKPKLDRMVENYYDTIFEMDFDITFCSGINNILADTLSRLFWPYNTLVESGNTRSIKDLDREILIKQDIVKQKGNKKRKNTHDDEVVAATKNKKQRVLNEEEKGKKDIKGAQDKNTVLSCESSSISNSSKVIIPNKTSDLFNNSKLTAYANSLKRKNEDFYFCVSHLDVYQTPTTDEEKQSILEKSHLLGHFGIHAMEQVIHQDLNMHWKGLREDITQYIRNCHKCRQFNLAKHVYHPPKQEAPEGIMDHVVFDLGGFDCTTPRGNNFILVVLDLFSRFIVLRAIPDKSATTVAKELVSIFSLLGYPRVVGHDRGAEFHNVLLEKILKHAGVENRASLAFTPQGNSCCEAAVKNCKTIIMKMLEGRSEDWDLYLNGTALSLNVHRSRLHGMMPFVVMFHRLPNEFKDYRGDKPVLHEKEIDVKAFKEKLDLIDKIIVPAIRDQIMKTQDKDSKYFRKRHRILENPYPVGSTVMIKNIENKNRKTDPNYEGPFYVHGHTRNGSYILTDRTNSFLARDVPTQQIKLISTSDTRDNPSNAYVVEAIINHKGSAPNYKYLVKWKGYSEDWNSWEPPSMFDSPDVVKQYWARVNANNSKTSKGKAPKALSTREIATRETKSRNKRERLLAKDDV
ncbi:uncharacterized protein ATC70_009707 [Mucor velutinosus]|uniref:Reverse transcriptase n=1 Tax=Mucor velutinosus TaxID=708070 RepID=A0AAN7I391_9FUNG|nr:hypothetical protein ATC70_009707 [Mucor velutinosus]